MYKTQYRMPRCVIRCLVKKTKTRKHTGQKSLGKNEYGEMEEERQKKDWSYAKRLLFDVLV